MIFTINVCVCGLDPVFQYRHYGSRKIGLKMINKIKLLAATAVLSLLSACGGGGGGGTTAMVLTLYSSTAGMFKLPIVSP